MKNTLLYLLGILFLSMNSHAQFIEYQEEQLDDPYIAVPKSKRLTSKAYAFKNSFIETVQVNVDSDGNNILNDAANEPSLAIDPTNPNRMVIGWRQFETTQSNFRQAGIAYTEDAGQIWTMLEPIEASVFRSDPVLDTDSEGNFYYNSLSNDLRCHVFKTKELSSWEDKTYAYGGDKQWMVIDKSDQPSNGNIYAFWKAQFSNCEPGSFTRSIDAGENYESCETVDSNPTRGTLAIDNSGNLYACGGVENGFRVLKSSSAKDPMQTVQWELNKSVNLDGQIATYAGPNPRGMLGQVWVATDNSNTATADNVYLLATVNRAESTGDPADIMFARSTDGGENWSEAIRINDDNLVGNWQWFGTISVAPNGRIDVVWLDGREFEGSRFSALFYSNSLDGGLSWSENRQVSELFDPHLGWPNQEKMGDYYQMISTEEGAHLAWAATFNEGQDIFYSFIPADLETAIKTAKTTNWELQILPNPAKDELQLSLSILDSGQYQFDFYDLLGKKVKQLPTRQLSSGLHTVACSVDKLRAGIYLLRIQNEQGKSQVERIVITD